jgi:hypothetical protein
MNARIDVLQPMLEDIMTLASIKDCLELKLHLQKKDWQLKSEYDRNEVELERFKINLELSRLKRQIVKSHKEFQEAVVIYIFSQQE